MMTPATVAGQDTGVTGAAEATLPDGASFNAVALKGATIGIGVSIARDGSATGQFHAVLQGTSLLGVTQEIIVEGKVSAGSVAEDGSATFSGLATVNMGNGTVPLSEVRFTTTASTGSLKLILDATTLPTATVTAGSITVK